MSYSKEGYRKEGIVQALKNNSYSTRELGHRTGIPHRAVADLLNKMREEGLVERDRMPKAPGRAYRWRLA